MLISIHVRTGRLTEIVSLGNKGIEFKNIYFPLNMFLGKTTKKHPETLSVWYLY